MWPSRRRGRSWSETIAVAIAALILVGVPGLALAYQTLHHPANEIALVGSVPTERGGGWDRREIHARVGETLRFRVTSSDVVHGFYLPDLGVNGQVEPGKYLTVEISPERPGTYTYYCNVLCSHRHGAMFGRLIVDPAR